LEYLSEKTDNKKAKILATTLDQATERFLDKKRSPSVKVKELDNRGSHFFLTKYWAEALADQTEDPEMKFRFGKLARYLRDNEEQILKELVEVQGKPVDLGGYYKLDDIKAARAMRPSITLNTIFDLFITRSL
ncbi:MAG: NADP-dependent isocitrate dehydrogenase, partial [Candidatus Tenebribacter davisii]|nr:NADP-dependent isocitrate dehydrogenase [Candidatus Tenebribacter davisii]